MLNPIVLCFLIYACFVENTKAAIFQTQFYYGNILVSLVYNNVTINSDRVMMVRVDLTNARIWLTTVNSATAVVKTIGCRRVSQERLIVGPRGCSNVNNPALAIESSNCVNSETERIRLNNIFQVTWWMPCKSSDCFIYGGNGDCRFCQGPFILALQNADTSLPQSSSYPTNKQLLACSGVYITFLTGPGAMMRVTYQVPMIMPKISLNIESATASPTTVSPTSTNSPTTKSPTSNVPTTTSPTTTTPSSNPTTSSPTNLPTQSNVPTSAPTAPTSAPTAPECTSWSGNYVSYAFDVYRLKLVGVWKAFALEISPGVISLQQRLLYQRVGDSPTPSPLEETTESVNFRIVLAETNGIDGGYNFIYQSGIQIGTDEVVGLTGGVSVIFENWIEQTLFSTPYTFYNVETDEVACEITLNIEAPTNKYELQTIEPITKDNWMFNKFPAKYYTAGACTPRWGALTEQGVEKYEDVPEGVFAGGDALFVHPDFPNLPVFVPPDPTLPYRLNCDEIYPKNETFQDYGLDGVTGTSTIPRISIDQQLCFFPFFSNAQIRAGNNPNERWRQCAVIDGGFLYGRAQTYCARPITYPSCKPGWAIAPGQRCVYKFNPTTDTRYAVPIDQSVQSCISYDANSQPVIEVDSDFEAWLLDRFLYLKTDVSNYALYRIPQYRSDRCTCYNSETKTENKVCSCYGVQDENGKYIFPICYYKLSSPGIEFKYKGILVSLKTAKTLIQGQAGPFNSGFQTKCACTFDRVGDDCQTPSCPPPLEISSAETLQPNLIFWLNCRAGGRGECFNGNPFVCDCNDFYAPSASIVRRLSYLYRFVDFPCMCPASANGGGPGGPVSPGFMDIDNTIYTADPREPYVACSFQGTCLINSTVKGTLNPAKCLSYTRINPRTKILEDGFDGLATSCEKVVLPYLNDVKNGLLAQDFCAGNGVCCPFGQTIYNPIGWKNDERCFNQETGKRQLSCACFNGKGGPNCVCPVPYNFAQDKIKELITPGNLSQVFVNLGEQYFVRYVKLTNCARPPYVAVSNQPLKPDSSIKCTYNTTSTLYDCLGGDLLAHQYIVLVGSTSLDCFVKAFEYDFQYCGLNGTANIFSGRFFALDYYRGRNRNQAQSYVGIANFGCTITECMCGPNNAGELCRQGVSSVRRTVIEVDGISESVWYKAVCGETDLLPTLLNPVQGRGQLDTVKKNCTCNALSTKSIMTGEACQCNIGTNYDRRSQMMCSGHGTCKPVRIPYGFCEVDLEKYRNDPLYYPYVTQTDFGTSKTLMSVDEDLFIYLPYTFSTSSPTKNPTQNPTENPTRNPTKDPTKNPTKKPTFNPTRNPTNNPTIKPTTNKPSGVPTKSPTKLPNGDFYGFVYLFSDNTAYTGNKGSRTSTNSYCSTAAYTYFQPGIGCNFGSPGTTISAALLSYGSGDTIENLPASLGFDGRASVYGVFASSSLVTLVARSWDNLVAGDLVKTFREAAIYQTPSFHWTGGLTGTSNTCSAWSTNSLSFLGIVGSGDSTTSTSLNSGTNTCSTQNAYVCMCAVRQFQAVPAHLVLHWPSVALTTGNLVGSRSSTTSTCETDRVYKNLECDTSKALLSYSTTDEIQDLSSIMGFSPTVAIYTPQGFTIASSWSDFISSTPATTLLETLVGGYVLPPTSTTFYTGGVSVPSGSPTPGTCNSWTGSTTAVVGNGLTLDTPTVLNTGSPTACTNILPYICVCYAYAPTASPTKNPTKLPSLNPTRKPTKLPTINPTKLPTNSPTQSPTYSLILVIYNPQVLAYGGDLGSYATSTAICDLYAPIECIATTPRMFIAYSLPPISLPGVSETNPAYARSPGGFPVYTLIANEAKDLYDPDGATILSPIGTALSLMGDFFTGANRAGSASDNCNDWGDSTSSYSYIKGNIIATTPPSPTTSWASDGTLTCDNQATFLCTCSMYSSVLN